MADSHPQVWPHDGLEVAPAEKERAFVPQQITPDGAPTVTGTAAPSYVSTPRGRRRRELVCGIPHRIFWALVSVLLFVVCAAIGIGAGVGVSLRNSGGNTNSAASATSASASTSPVATSGTPGSTATATPATSAPTCPGGNGTFWSSQGSGFLVLCGRDYSGVGVALDLKAFETSSLEDCIRNCAINLQCTGAGWGPYPTTPTCWLKAQLNLSQPTWMPGWSFAAKINQ